MSKNEVPKIAREALSDVLDRPGGILYSSHETLKEGNVYLLGFNPGGEASTDNPTIEDSIDNMLTKTDNAYLDEIWGNSRVKYKKGEAPLQKRVQSILKGIGLEPENVCASNLIFLQSSSADKIDHLLAEKCWPVHEKILDIVKPKLIIAFGNGTPSTFSYLRSLLGGEEVSYPLSKHDNWSLKVFECQINGRQVCVVGLPHLSYPPKKNHIDGWLSWLSEKIK